MLCDATTERMRSFQPCGGDVVGLLNKSTLHRGSSVSTQSTFDEPRSPAPSGSFRVDFRHQSDVMVFQ